MRTLRSARDVEEARRTVHELRTELGRLRKMYRRDREGYERTTRGMRDVLHETVLAIEAYEQAESARLPPVMSARDPVSGRLEVARLLRMLRRAAQLDQAELAERLGVVQSQVSRMERDGYDRYVLAHLARVVDILGYDLDVTLTRRRRDED